MRLYSPVDLTGNVNMIEKLVLGRTGTGDLPGHNIDYNLENDLYLKLHYYLLYILLYGYKLHILSMLIYFKYIWWPFNYLTSWGPVASLTG